MWVSWVILSAAQERSGQIMWNTDIPLGHVAALVLMEVSPVPRPRGVSHVLI